jgi:hypothetical protein
MTAANFGVYLIRPTSFLFSPTMRRKAADKTYAAPLWSLTD